MEHEFIELNGLKFIYENHESYNAFFYAKDWSRSLQKLKCHETRILGYTKNPSYCKMDGSCPLWGIALQDNESDFFWFHIQDWMVNWISKELTGQEIFEE